jgi:hypothetical protein
MACILVVRGECATLNALLGDSPAGVCRVESTISLLIGAAESGDCVAADTLFSTLYSELHRMAKRELARKGLPNKSERYNTSARGLSRHGRA